MRVPALDIRGSYVPNPEIETETDMPTYHQTPALAARRLHTMRACPRCRRRKATYDMAASQIPCVFCRLGARNRTLEARASLPGLAASHVSPKTEPRISVLPSQAQPSGGITRAKNSSSSCTSTMATFEPWGDPMTTVSMPAAPHRDELREAMEDLLSDDNAIMTGLADFLHDERRDKYPTEKRDATGRNIPDLDPLGANLVNSSHVSHPMSVMLFSRDRYNQVSATRQFRLNDAVFSRQQGRPAAIATSTIIPRSMTSQRQNRLIRMS
ncbi:hypothetical protein B0J13DRAFT_1167 [Dactylonectria estremocensis]|uniref:Uncharacterized protein n=1 Tax=Dactylonectria estremocensis TaxID=1079267 RepID=A0A9P9FH93_9HYPO|nr:hypothetical protein B0J13DRAFT_1167 [Dactylonectria estremocensis]